MLWGEAPGTNSQPPWVLMMTLDMNGSCAILNKDCLRFPHLQAVELDLGALCCSPSFLTSMNTLSPGLRLNTAHVCVGWFRCKQSGLCVVGVFAARLCQYIWSAATTGPDFKMPVLG